MTLRALRSLKSLHNSKLLDSARDVIYNCVLHLPCEFANIIIHIIAIGLVVAPKNYQMFSTGFSSGLYAGSSVLARSLSGKFFFDYV